MQDSPRVFDRCPLTLYRLDKRGSSLDDRKEVQAIEINGFGHRYEINEDGTIYTTGNHYNGYKHKRMKTRINRCGYEQVCLSKDGTQKTYLVHRLIADAFLPNPNGLPCVNHNDGNKSNNHVDNLEWVTRSENSKHAVEHNLSGFRDTILSHLEAINKNTRYTKVVLSKDGNAFLFGSTSDAAKFLGISEKNKYSIIRAHKKGHNCKGYKVVVERAANGET